MVKAKYKFTLRCSLTVTELKVSTVAWNPFSNWLLRDYSFAGLCCVLTVCELDRLCVPQIHIARFEQNCYVHSAKNNEV